VLLQFNRSVNLLYRKSVEGKQPEWIARWLDQGKPAELIQWQRAHALKNEVPRVIRPDILLTENGFSITELDSVPGGIGLVKLMGRHAGFITAGATVASQDVNFALIPEVPFKLDVFLAALKQRMVTQSHAVIAVAEGAAQDLLEADGAERDASGNVKLKDVGRFLRTQIETFFKAEGLPVTVRYFDPSYQIRSRPANCEDAVLCDLFARHAVHAAMAGKTGVVIGFLHERFIHVPIELLATKIKRVDPASGWWRSVLATTGQPEHFS